MCPCPASWAKAGQIDIVTSIVPKSKPGLGCGTMLLLMLSMCPASWAIISKIQQPRPTNNRGVIGCSKSIGQEAAFSAFDAWHPNIRAIDLV